MEIYILNKNLEEVYVIDAYKSVIWTTRYYTFGDFELYIPASEELLDYIQEDYYVTRNDDESVMVIEKIEIKTDIEDGDFYIITGSSLESILARRIVWAQTNISAANPVTGINRLITENAISPSNASRTIDKLEVAEPITITGPLDCQFTGTNLSDAVTAICKQFKIGFKIRIVNNKFVCSCYKGSTVNVIFSPEFDNLVSSDYIYDSSEYRNIALVAGEGEGSNRKTSTVYNTSYEPEDLDRREMFIDARDINSNNGEIPAAQYIDKLNQRGYEKLAENKSNIKFENEIIPNLTYIYKQDYNLGDIVTLMNGYGITINPRITEIIENWDDNGYTIIPTFEEEEV